MTPWELVKKSEHSHQRAVFAWANCAARYGFWTADQPEGYVKEHRDLMFKSVGQVGGPVPELHRLFAIHNQGHGDKIRGAQAKAEGVKAGVPDIMLPVSGQRAGCGLFIELKRPKLKGKVQAGTESDIQADWRAYLTGQGYVCHVCVGWQEAVAAIKDYLK